MTVWTSLGHTPFSLDFVSVAGQPTRSLRAGPTDAQNVLFLHGTSSHLEVFTGNVPAHAGQFRVHAIDMLGHGYSAKPDRDLEVPDYVEHVLGYLDAAGVDRVHLVGESLGGWVCAHLAAEHPDRVRSLQLVASGGSRAVPAIMARIRETTMRAALDPDRQYTRDRLANLLHDPATVDEELVDIRYAIYHQPEFQAMLPHLLCMQDMDVRQRNLLRPDRLARISAPTQIFWGRHNPVGDISEGEDLAGWIPGARLQVFEGCGHFPQLEFPDKFDRLSLEFLRSA